MLNIIGFSSVTLGSVIILLSFSIALLICLFICMVLSLRNNRRREMSCSSVCPLAIGHVSAQSTLSTSFTSISAREPERDARCSAVGLSSSSPLSSSSGTQTDFQSFGSSVVSTTNGVLRGSQRMAALRSTSSLPSKAVRPASLSVNQALTCVSSLNHHRRTFKLSSSEDGDTKFPFKAFFPSDTDESVSSPQLPRIMEFRDIAGRCEKLRFSVGYIFICLSYAFTSNSLQVDILPNYFFPQKEFYKESDLYAKLVVVTGRNRMKRSARLTTFRDNPVIASFVFQINSIDLAESSMIISLCKNLENDLTEGMLIGSGNVHFESLAITDSLTEDFESDALKIPLFDSIPQQMTDCGGFLKAAIEYLLQQEEIVLTNMYLLDINLTLIQFAESKGAIYLKIAVYENGIAVCWRRTHPVSIIPSTKDILLTDRISFPLTTAQFKTAQVILSIRLKTGKRGERKILGNFDLRQSLSDLDERMSSASVCQSENKCSFKSKLNNSM